MLIYHNRVSYSKYASLEILKLTSKYQYYICIENFLQFHFANMFFFSIDHIK